MLPEDIRILLESTYANAAIDEPQPWTDLRHELERQKDRMTMKALNATSIWSIPALDDEEGVQTRWETCPVAHLLLATQVMSLDSRGDHAILLDGSEIKANEEDWSFNVAKAVHRNLVRIPLWSVARRHSPAWLSTYVPGVAVFGLLQPDGQIVWPSRSEATGLAYDADQGVVIAGHAGTLINNGELNEPYN
jgi:hypothetical protein